MEIEVLNIAFLSIYTLWGVFEILVSYFNPKKYTLGLSDRNEAQEQMNEPLLEEGQSAVEGLIHPASENVPDVQDASHPAYITMLFLLPLQQIVSSLIAVIHLFFGGLSLYQVFVGTQMYLDMVRSFLHVSLGLEWLFCQRIISDIQIQFRTRKHRATLKEYWLSNGNPKAIQMWAIATVFVYPCQMVLFGFFGIKSGLLPPEYESILYRYAVLILMSVLLCGSIAFSVAELYKYNEVVRTIAEDIESAPLARDKGKNWLILLGISLKYVWPASRLLRLRAVSCIFLVVLLRLLNLAVPYAYKTVIDHFSISTQSSQSLPMETLLVPVAIWLALSFAQGGAGGGTVGILPNLRQYLWIRISQDAYRRISLDIFSHVLALDHNFHLHRRTGEILKIMDRGTTSIQTLLGTVMFQILPQLFDIVSASIFLAIKMKAWIAVIVFCTLSTYIPLTVALTEWRAEFRREMNKYDNARSGRATDVLLNYETVKIFANEEYERTQYAEAIDKYQSVEFKLLASLNALNMLQSCIIFLGLSAGMTICTVGIYQKTLTVGDVVLFVTLMQQLFQPLNFFGTYYRMLQNSVLDMEGVFKLLEAEPDVKDEPGSKPFYGNDYSIRFKSVQFAYNRIDNILKDVTFFAPGGKTTALVGTTGSGKSSIIKLLLRFYNPTSGSISIGTQDISKIKIKSLRTIMSVVPQDPVLFNDTIRMNIAYGKPDATDEEVVRAADGACIDETISNKFPQGYDTLVGERGLRLSGGEKQRVAFARAMLQNPPILILDEATSSLDSITENRLQKTLSMKRLDRTVLIVAHRLSTIIDADCIIVVENGHILETGTHNDLLRLNGKYSALWKKQASGTTTVEEAEGSSHSTT